MIEGNLDENLQLLLPLTILHKAKTHNLSFLVDTGFNGYLSVSPELVQELNLAIVDVQRGITADGRVGFFERVDVCVIWNERPCVIRAQVLDEALIGTRLLDGYDLSVRWEAGGEFRLSPIPRE